MTAYAYIRNLKQKSGERSWATIPSWLLYLNNKQAKFMKKNYMYCQNSWFDFPKAAVSCF